MTETEDEHSSAARGRDDPGRVTDTPTGTGFTAIASGGNHGLALRADGSIAACAARKGGSVLTRADAAILNQRS